MFVPIIHCFLLENNPLSVLQIEDLLVVSSFVMAMGHFEICEYIGDANFFWQSLDLTSDQIYGIRQK